MPDALTANHRFSVELVENLPGYQVKHTAYNQKWVEAQPIHPMCKTQIEDAACHDILSGCTEAAKLTIFCKTE